jgi:CRISPR/Cas system-associated exonuclease Cas4 (RecB family)
LKPKAAQLADLLVDGRPHAKKELTEKMGMKMNSTFANLMTDLKKAKIMEKAAGDSFQLTAYMRKYEKNTTKSDEE